MADLKLSGAATMAVKHKQKSELKVQRDCHSTDKIYCCNSPWLWDQRRKNTKYTDTFLFIYTWRRRGKQIIYKEEGGKGNKVSLHVSISQFIQEDFVIAGVCFWSPLFVYWHFAMLKKKNSHTGARDSREQKELRQESRLLPRERMFLLFRATTPAEL